MWRPERLAGSVLLAAALCFPLTAAAASDEDVQRVGEQLVCYCGCSGQTVAACTCGTADAIRERIRGQLDQGLSVDQVVQEWVAERGEQVLAVPTREGFNLVGWVMPFVVTLVATGALLMLLLRRQRHDRSAAPVEEPSEEESRYLAQIERDVRSLKH